MIMMSQWCAVHFSRNSEGKIAPSPRTARRSKRCPLLHSLLLTFLAVCLAMPLGSRAQDSGGRERKVITRIDPQYPATLQRLYIGGVVRLQVVVAPNGSVQSATLVGGNPILGQSAITAVKQWKYAPGNTSTTLTERIEFDPHR